MTRVRLLQTREYRFWASAMGGRHMGFCKEIGAKPRVSLENSRVFVESWTNIEEISPVSLI